MKKVSISGSPRENVGKKDAKLLRRQGMVPCVLYGGEKQVYFQTEEKNFKELVYTPDAKQVLLNIDGNQYHAILQDIQFHKLEDRILHVDFLQLFPDKPVLMEIPIIIKGSSVGVLKGGKLNVKKRKLKIIALPDDMPQIVEVDISPMDIGNIIRVEDIQLDKVKIKDNNRDVIVSVLMTRAVVDTPETAGKPAAK